MSYPNSVIQLSPIAYYRMPLRTQGLACSDPEFTGELLTGKGIKAVWAPGFIGSSLRVGGRSIGRGGLVQPAPPLVSGQLTILAWVRADARASEATIVTDGSMKHGEGSFLLSLDNETGLLKAMARSESGELVSCKDTEIIPLATWIHVAVTVDGNQLKLFRDGVLTSSADCTSLSNKPSPSLVIGTKPSGRKRWEGRIDEVALFDKALSTEEIRELYETAVEHESELMSERIKEKMIRLSVYKKRDQTDFLSRYFMRDCNKGKQVKQKYSIYAKLKRFAIFAFWLSISSFVVPLSVTANELSGKPKSDLAEFDRQAASEAIDQVLEKSWEAEGIEGNGLLSDELFVRRVYLDVIGRIPTTTELESFLQDQRE